ncbi:BON domain-containing protein [Streptomyces sp. NBC_01310]|uniref:BON domain-containing protein n=1 Tax=Streptomyces sp. NBC_01310 TaxID=2903820 RepID=UPI0035B67F3A
MTGSSAPSPAREPISVARKGVKRLPVVNEVGLLEGVVSRSDLLQVFLRPDEELEVEIRQVVLAELAPGVALGFSVQDGVVVLRGPLRDRALVPLLARAIRAVEGVVDVRMELDGAVSPAWLVL